MIFWSNHSNTKFFRTLFWGDDNSETIITIFFPPIKFTIKYRNYSEWFFFLVGKKSIAVYTKLQMNPNAHTQRNYTWLTHVHHVWKIIFSYETLYFFHSHPGCSLMSNVHIFYFNKNWILFFQQHSCTLTVYSIYFYATQIVYLDTLAHSMCLSLSLYHINK